VASIADEIIGDHSLKLSWPAKAGHPDEIAHAAIIS
jgi:hypothetical protein